ncbi:MAG: phosphatase PAP2 family protein [Bacteroidaceae bacterium]|nr:phosphatase PAP2 family protein [Bacteroidaceae bacterium]
MKKVLLAIVATVLTTSSIWGQRPDGFLTEQTRPKQYDFIKEYPPLTSGAFAYDFYYYQWGREQREDQEVSQQALWDESAELYEVFGESKCIGINLTYETTPEIILLCERAVTDAQIANTAVKNKYQRLRPFFTFKEESLKPWTDDEEGKTLSYPSGHSSRGYMFALALCTIAPEYTTEIMLRAQEYALNRVICGHHWKTDTDASLLLAATMFANVVCTEGYQAQLKKAIAEYKSLTDVETRTEAPAAETASRSAAIYDMNGRRLNAKPDNGVYIQDGEKYMAK